MKKVLNVGIGGKSFTIDEDAYHKLNAYLEQFRQKTHMGYQTKEVMDELEMRISDLFTDSLTSRQEVVNMALVDKVIAQLGMPDGSESSEEYSSRKEYNFTQTKAPRRFYRDPDNKAIGGVCSGLALYLDIDIVIVRVLFVVALICGSLGFWVYVILWIVAPLATTAAQKCEMRGIPVTAENLRKFSTNR